MASAPLTFYHAPRTRSTGTRVLLEELGAEYEMKVLNLRAGESRAPAYLAINPMGKVPAILHGDALVTEQPAVFLYLADLFPAAGLAPALDDPLRGPYLRWMVFYGSAFEPALIDKSLGREPAPPSRSAYGTFENVMDALQARLREGPYMLGERFLALDILWGIALNWTVGFGLVPALPEIKDYVARVTTRPSFARVTAQDEELDRAFTS